MDTTTLDSFFTIESLVSLQGSTAAILLVTNVLGYLIGPNFDKYKKWLAFGLSLVFAYTVAALAADAGFVKWILAFLNGFLIFASAAGLNEMAGGRSLRTAPLALPASGPKKFFASWFG